VLDSSPSRARNVGRIASARAGVYADAQALLAELARAIRTPPYVAERIFLEPLARRAFQAASGVAAQQQLLRFAYSVKTNPRGEILALAREAGLLAEVIHPLELQHALACGFSGGECVYNGPYPAIYCDAEPGIVFADSFESYAAVCATFKNALIGVRVRPCGISSHFGIPPAQLDACAQAIAGAGKGRFGVSFHVRPQDYGSRTWRDIVEGALEMALELQRRSGARAVAFDAGGGNVPQDFDASVDRGDFSWLSARALEVLADLQTILAEPGQALATPCEAVVAPVLEVRRREGCTDVVVDAGYPDVSQIGTYEHRLYLARDGELRAIERGGTCRIVGRTCLEYDLLANDVLLDEVGAGDAVVIADAGAYDASMRFAFARGRAGNT